MAGNELYGRAFGTFTLGIRDLLQRVEGTSVQYFNYNTTHSNRRLSVSKIVALRLAQMKTYKILSGTLEKLRSKLSVENN